MKISKNNCTACVLHTTAHTIGMEGPLKSTSPKLLIYIDHPSKEEDQKHKSGSSDNVKMVLWLLDRMSVKQSDVSIQYSLKCYKSKQQLKKKDERLQSIKSCERHRMEELHRLMPKAIVTMGPISCEAFFNGVQAKTKAGWKWQTKSVQGTQVERVWATNSPSSAVPPASPAESVELYRVLFKAAEEANLNPHHNPNAAPYPFDL